ncbi:MAG: enoyl-CoA hydratase/isomerase family protein [Allosphingosinicella sp.]|uniref:enoyl-CoA hydratase/isomerase family protein n=1 Tax=Allosphingosinicella sp. TaxID=2823234 RepID=UPI00395A3B85
MGDVAQSVLVERDGPIARIVLNRPDRINAINQSIREGLPEALRALDADDEVRVIVVKGAGERGFSAGADIRESRGAELPIDAHRRLRDDHWIDAFDCMTKPTVAAIHGYCMGGGLEIALACDIRIASADAVFALPETGLGLIPGAGGTQRLPRLIGIGPALDLLMSNDRIDAAAALRLGLITRLAEGRAELYAQADELARKIAAKPPAAIAFARRAAYASTALPLAEGLGLERDLFALLLTTEDQREAARAFIEKRRPVFNGR